MVISKKLLVIICGSSILTYLVILSQNNHQVSNGKSTTNATASPFMRMDGIIKFFGLKSETYPDASQPVLVLILTYMRSGSSLTGDILQHSPGSFYVYEPFRSLGHKNASTYTLIYANGSESITQTLKKGTVKLYTVVGNAQFAGTVTQTCPVLKLSPINHRV